MKITKDFLDEKDYGGIMKPKYIIIHHTGTKANAEQNKKYFDREDIYLSSHYIVAKDGKILHVVPNNRKAWHAGISEYNGKKGFNDFSIGIEIASDGKEFTEKQKNEVKKLIRMLMSDYNISAEKVLRHADIAPGRKTDVGENFYKEYGSWKNYQADLTPMGEYEKLFENGSSQGKSKKMNNIDNLMAKAKDLSPQEIVSLMFLLFNRD